MIINAKVCHVEEGERKIIYTPCRYLEIHLLPLLRPDIVRHIQFTVEFGSGFRPHDAKVDELDAPIQRQQNIIRLDVSVRDFPRIVVKIG